MMVVWSVGTHGAGLPALHAVKSMLTAAAGGRLAATCGRALRHLAGRGRWPGRGAWGGGLASAPPATRTRALPLRGSPVAVDIHLAGPYVQLALPVFCGGRRRYP